MNAETRRPLLVAVAGATLLSLAALLWLARDLIGVRRQSAANSLFELLDEGRRPSAARPSTARPAPSPPRLQAWSSPLRQSCPIRDPVLQGHLETMKTSLSERRRRVPIDPSNYGRRFDRDIYGNPIDPTPRMVVLHETVYGLESALNTFRTHHPNDDDQVSYHTLIGLDGQVIDTVDPADRAFGAGHSAFLGRWVHTSRKVSGSVNNFALHLSLESPLDGEDAAPGHSGYSAAQYDALAVVLADWMSRFPITPEAITTHRHVDVGGERADPRSFDWRELQRRLAALGLIC